MDLYSSSSGDSSEEEQGDDDHGDPMLGLWTARTAVVLREGAVMNTAVVC